MRLALALLSMAALGCQCQRPKSSAPTLENSRAAEYQTWATQLSSDDHATWREAQLLLAREAPTSLRALDQVVSQSPLAAERARQVLDLALRRNTAYADVALLEQLHTISLPLVERGQRAAYELERDQVLDFDSRALQTLRELKGFGVPAARELLESENPVARGYGVQLVMESKAAVTLPRLGQLAFDEAHFEVKKHGSSAGQGSVSAMAMEAKRRSEARPGLPLQPYEVWLELLTSDELLTTTIRERTPVTTARTWEQYWFHAQPLWKQWWSMAPVGAVQPSDLSQWRSHWNDKDGFTLERTPAVRNDGTLTVKGPEGAVAAVRWNGNPGPKGPVPLVVNESPGWVITELEVTLPGGKVWKKQLRYDRRESLVVTVLP